MEEKDIQLILREAKDALGVAEDELIPFEEEDPFHPGNVVQGAVSRREDQRYGAMFLRLVNGKYQPQVIYGTPKIDYPFSPRPDGRRVYHFPAVRKVEIYEKLDGTNILAYVYTDGRQQFVTYKTRLVPVLKSSRWGDWVGLWSRMLDRYQNIPLLPVENGCGVSFELYGSANPHLISYETPLDTRVLFGVKAGGAVVPPSCLNTFGVPAANLEATVGSQDQLAAEYERFREKMAAANRQVAHEGKFVREGMVLYCHTTDGSVVLFKCKPEDIEEIHWASSNLSKAIIRQACFKVVENEMDLNEENLRRILAEDWDSRAIDGAVPLVRETLNEVVSELSFRVRVLEEYRALGLTLREDKSAVMRALSQRFPRGEMRKVYTAIAFEEGML